MKLLIILSSMIILAACQLDPDSFIKSFSGINGNNGRNEPKPEPEPDNVIIISNNDETTSATSPKPDNSETLIDDFFTKYGKNITDPLELLKARLNLKNAIQLIEAHNEAFLSGAVSYEMGLYDFADEDPVQVLMQLCGTVKPPTPRNWFIWPVFPVYPTFSVAPTLYPAVITLPPAPTTLPPAPATLPPATTTTTRAATTLPPATLPPATTTTTRATTTTTRATTTTTRATTTTYRAATTLPPANPISKDWRSVMMPVIDQGRCGSCWSFAAIGQVESLYKRKIPGFNTPLSTQYLVDCSRNNGNNGCEGGWPKHALDYLKANGVVAASNYVYAGVQSYCKNVPKIQNLITSTYEYTLNGDEAVLKNMLDQEGPLAIVIYVTNNLLNYKGGVFQDTTCPTSCSDVNHGVILVGYGTDAATGKDFWLVRNSWGPTWGEQGHIRMLRNRGNNCLTACSAMFSR